ncbi:MAG: glycine--tRNA ligase subunit beta [Rhodobacteraceae bacterium]|nr:glycine--tRNA ligase subunit beta [Paracoccaceae bacterium]
MDYLLELFSEEIPARMQKRAGEDLKKLVTNGLVEAGITYESAAVFTTPRRLCLNVCGVLEQSPTLREERKGPRVSAPDKAIEGFLRGAGVAREDLVVKADKKGDIYVVEIVKPGRGAAEVLTEVVSEVIRKFPWPKSMRWGAGQLRWVRPLHSVLSILSKEEVEVVPVDVDVPVGDSTEGHRFMAPGRFSVSGFEDYEAKLKAAYVMLDPSERADLIWHDATNGAFALGLEVVDDRALLAEVAGLVEWPVVLMGDIAEDFFALPAEVLQSSMREHQKFFSVRNPKTGRIEKFVTVANRETADGGATILAGNQKVLFARLSDAKFFWENDLRVPLGEMAAKLEKVTFHNKLGTQAERVARIAALAREIATDVDADPALAEQAAEICKADLMSEMVYEFPELQGLMGRYYAEAAGMPAEVANACEQHWQPLGPSDNVPTEPVSVAVALADKIDTLTGFWAIDEKPTGSKDPFALRRAALGVIRLVLANDLRGALRHIFVLSYADHVIDKLQGLQGARSKASAEFAKTFGFTDDEMDSLLSRKFDEMAPHEEQKSFVKGFANQVFSLENPTVLNLLSFFHDRLKVYLKDKGIRHDVIDACLKMPGNDDLTLLVKRAEALQAFLNTDDGENLLQGFKRANNILRAEEKKDGVSYEGEPDVKFAEEPAEKALFAALKEAAPKIETALNDENIEAAMAALAALRAPIDGFFDGVQVNADKPIVRRNRLCLLNEIRAVMHKVAVFSEING